MALCFFSYSCGGGGDSEPGTPPTINEVGVYKEIENPNIINIQIINEDPENNNNSNPQDCCPEVDPETGTLQIGDKFYKPLHTVNPEPNSSNYIVETRGGQGNTMYGFYVSIHASDPEVDMHTLHVEQYRDGSENPVYVDTVELSEQQISNQLYWNAFYIFGRPGYWRTSFMIQDATGRNSNVYWLHTHFH